MKERTATFIGHRDCLLLDEAVLKCEIEKLIKLGYIDFLCGGMGGFDKLCARCVWSLKGKYPHVKSYLIIPYLTFRDYEAAYYDDILYPEGFEKYYFKRAIKERNRFLVDHASAAVCYITHMHGGAAETYRMADRKGLLLINLGNKA